MKKYWIAYVAFAVFWMGGSVVRAQQQRHSLIPDPNPITIESFRFQSLEDRTTLLETSRFAFAEEMAAIKVSVQELIKTQDATRTLLIGMCPALLGLFAEMCFRLLKRQS